MKMTRKLIPALAMLLVSAIMLSTASFAWFASNASVKAQDMTVTVQTGASFLEISNAEDGTYLTYADATNKKYSTEGGKKGLDLVRAVLSGTGEAKKELVWQTGTSGTTTAPTDSETAYTQVYVDAAGANYALINEFWVRMSAGSTETIEDLSITGVTATTTSGQQNNLIKALRVLVVGENGIQLWTNTTGIFALDASSNSMLLDEVDKTAQKLTVYIYFDGDDPSAYTNNTYTDGVLTLADIQVSVTFG